MQKAFNPVETNAPAIGVQRKVDTHGTLDESDDTVSVRFVAAISVAGDLADATAVWTRAIFAPDGTALKAQATWPSVKAYTTIDAEGDPYTIDDYNTACGGSYTHFVAYTMRNIPLSTYANYYFTAYLTVTDGGGENTSKVIATTIDQSTQFSFRTSDTGYFAVKHTSSGFEAVSPAVFDNGGHYRAEFEGMSFGATDSFLVVNRGVNQFQVFGYDAAHAADPLDTEFTQVGGSQFLDCRFERSYFIHLDESNHLNVQEAFAKTLYFKPNANWSDGSSRYVIALKFEGESEKRVYALNKIGDTSTYQCDLYYVNPLPNAPISFYKMPSDNPANELLGKPSILSIGWPLGTDDMFTMNISNNKGYWSIRTEADPVVETGNFTITDFTEPVEIHTDLQKTFLSYEGEYKTIPTSYYPSTTEDLHQSDSLAVNLDFTYNVPGGQELDHFSVVYGKEADLSDGYEKVGDNTTTLSFYNPYLGKNYYKLVATFTDTTTEESAIHSFYVDATYPRNLTVAGMTNCRDMGGRLLEDGGVFKQGMIYRTSGSGQNGDWGSLKATAEEEMVGHLGVTKEIYVAEGSGTNKCEFEGVDVKHFAMDWNASDGSNNFSRNAVALKKFYEYLANPSNYPVFFHCRIGTDRTGVCALTLGGLLGVSLDELYQDYLFSNFGKIGSTKRFLSEVDGHDCILRYTEYIEKFSGATFKNKVYNALLSVGISPETLNAVINNLTDGPRATGNDAGQITAFGDQLTGEGVVMSEYDNSTDTSVNHPSQYYVLDSNTKSVKYVFSAAEAYQAQIVAYMATGSNSTDIKLDDVLGLAIDDIGLTIRDVNFKEAGMGTISGGRWMYYPVILGIADITAGDHMIEINGKTGTVNIAGITILNASDAVDIGGGAPSGKDPKHVHEYGDWIITTAATCEHPGEKYHQCECGKIETQTIPQLAHSWGDPVSRYAAGNDGVNDYPETFGYNCATCHKGALCWSAKSYDTSSSEVDVHTNYIRFNSAQQANAGNDGVEGGGHIVYMINVPVALQHAGLQFYITPHNSNVAIFDTVSGDSGMGADFVGGQVVAPTKRYALYINDQRIEIGNDPGASTETGWYTWPVDFSLNAGVNKVELVSMGGYRAQMMKFQFTGFDEFESNHEHVYSAWQSNETKHWKTCTADGCVAEEGHHFFEGAHTFGPVEITVNATCDTPGSGTQTCTECGYVKDVVIPPAGHTLSAEETRHTDDYLDYYESSCSVCSKTFLRFPATSGTLVGGSTIKSGTPSGFVKLTSGGDSISYTFYYQGSGTTAKIYQRAVMDGWGSATNQGKKYSSSASGTQGCNFAFEFNSEFVTIDATAKGTAYSTLLANGTDSGLDSSFSKMADCLIAEVDLLAGENSFVYTRKGSYNLCIHDFVIVIE